MLIRPSTSQRRPSTRTTSGSSSGSNSSWRSPTSAARRSFTVMHPLDPTELVDDHREGPPFAAHLGQDVEHRAATRAPGRAGGVASRCRWCSGGCPPSSGPLERPVQPARKRSFTNSTPTRSSRLSSHTGKHCGPTRGRPGRPLHGQRDRQADDVDPRGHHLADHHVAEIGQGGDDEALLGVRPALDGQTGRFGAGGARTAPLDRLPANPRTGLRGDGTRTRR